MDFPAQEYQGRIARIQDKMRERGIDVLVLLAPETIHYVCGYDAAWLAPLAEFSGVIIPADTNPTLLVRSLEIKTARKQAINSRFYQDWEGPWKALKEVVAEARALAGTIGVEENGITMRKLDGLKEAFPEARIVRAGGLVEGLMAEPSELEIEYTRKAGRITQAGFEKALAAIGRGVPLYKVINAATEAMYEAGMTEQRLDGMYTISLVFAGPDGGAMHETDVTRRIEKGDLVVPEVWGTYKHYTAGCQGTVYVGGKPSPEILATYQVMSEMYSKAKEAMRLGVPIGEVWETASRAYRAAYGVDYYRILGPQQGAAAFIGRLGRGLKDRLKPGASYLLQPQVNDPLLISVAATVMVAKDGPEEITKPLLELVTV